MPPQQKGALLVKHSALYAVARGVPALINLAGIAVYTRLLAPNEYGTYAIVLTAIVLTNVLLFQWLRLCLLRFLPLQLHDPMPLLSLVFTGFGSVSVATAVIALLVAIWPYEWSWRWLTVFAVPILWAHAWFEINLELARSKLQPGKYGVMSAAKSAISLVTGTALILLGSGAYGPLLGLLLGSVIVAAFSWHEWKGISLRRFDSQLMHDLVAYGLPLSITLSLAMVVSSSDRFLLAWFLDEEAAGFYSAAYEITWHALGTLTMVINLAAYPLALRALKDEGIEGARLQLGRNLTLLVVVALPAAIGLWVLAPNVSRTVFGQAFWDATETLIPWMAVSALLGGFKYYFDLAFQLSRNTSLQMWMMALVAAINIVLNMLWIPSMGILGAVYASLVAYVLALLLSFWLGRRCFPLPLFNRDSLKILVAAVVMGLALWPTRSFVGLGALLAQITCGMLVYGFALVTLDVGNSWRRIRQLLLY
jgi:O-antigen/teichoic acid export membrane protein